MTPDERQVQMIREYLATYVLEVQASPKLVILAPPARYPRRQRPELTVLALRQLLLSA